MLILLERDVGELLSTEEYVAAMEEAYRAISGGRIVHSDPARLRFVFDGNRKISSMCAYDKTLGLVACKLPVRIPGNPDRGLPLVSATLLLWEGESGRLLAAIQATRLTEVRTAAGTAVAVRHLARKDAKSLGVFGAGAQARAHCAIVRGIRDFKHIRVMDLNSDMAEALVRGLPAEECDIRVAASAAEILACDVIICATTSRTPILAGKDIRPGTLVVSIGATDPAAREVDSDLVCWAKVVVDSRSAVLEEAGDLLIPISEGKFSVTSIYAEIGEIVLGLTGQGSEEEVIFFKGGGLAGQDLMIGHRLYRKALQRNIGTIVEF